MEYALSFSPLFPCLSQHRAATSPTAWGRLQCALLLLLSMARLALVTVRFVLPFAYNPAPCEPAEQRRHDRARTLDMTGQLARTRTARDIGQPLGSTAALCAGVTAVFLAAGALTEPQAAFAEQLESGAPAKPTEHSALGVKLSLGQSGFDPNAVRAAIARELGVPVVEATDDSASPSWLEVRADTAERASVDYCGSGGRCVGRSIGLPAQRERALETIALLASNVVRNEAAELIEALERRAAAARASTEATQNTTQASSAAPRAPVKPAPKTATPPAAANRPLVLQEPGVNLSLWHPIAILPDSDRRRLHFELGLGYSRAGAIEGMATNALFARVDQQLDGMLVAGLGAWAGGDSRGMIAGGLGVLSQGRLRGAEFGGLVSLHLGHGSGPYGVDAWSGAVLEGIQTSGLWSHAAGDVVGAQVAGGMSTLAGNLTGMQAAGAVNWTQGSLEGLQAAGALNWAEEDVDGFQGAAVNISRGSMTGFVAGVVNLAGLRGPSLSSSGFEAGVVNIDRASFRGLQLGVVNVSGPQTGAQVGVVNISDELDGVPVGLVNLGGSTHTSMVAFTTNRTPANLGVKFLTGYTFSMLSAGYDPKGTSQGNAHEVLQSALQFGGHIPFAGRGAIEPSVGYAYETYLNELDASVGAGHVALYRGALSWHFIPEFGVFAGGGLRQRISHRGDVSHEAEGFGGVEVF